MRRPGGYAVITAPDSFIANLDNFRCEQMGPGVTEIDTIMCGHCGRQMHIKPFMDPADMGGLCKQCMKYECPDCVDKGCTPLEKRLEQAEERARTLRSYEL